MTVSSERHAWSQYSRIYMGAVEAFYRPSTLAVMRRGLSRVGDAIVDLRAAGKVTTTHPKKLGLKDVVAFLAWMRTCPGKHGGGIQPSTQENYYEYLVGFLRWIENPVAQELEISSLVHLPQRAPAEVIALSESALKRLQSRLTKMPGWDGCVARFMVAVCANTGLRRSELRLARLRDLDMKAWRITVTHPKSHAGWAPFGVVMVLPPARKEVREFLKERKEYLASHGIRECESLVPRIWRNGEAGYWTDAMWGKMKGEAQRFARIPFRIRDLRATFAQMCKDRGASIEAVSRVLRHRTILTTEMYYARMRPEAAFRELEGLFASRLRTSRVSRPASCAMIGGTLPLHARGKPPFVARPFSYG